MAFNSLTIAQVEEKNLIASDRAYIACLHIEIRDINTPGTPVVENIYLAGNDEDITINGQLYSQFNFDLEMKSELGAQPTLSLSLMDVTRDIQYRMQNQNGGIGSIVNIIIINEQDLDGPPEVVERFEVVSASASGYNVTWTLGAQNLLAQRFPRRAQMKDRCGWTFKDPETCAYSGSDTSCDYTLQGSNGCSMKSNNINFGGFPGIRSSGARYA